MACVLRGKECATTMAPCVAPLCLKLSSRLNVRVKGENSRIGLLVEPVQLRTAELSAICCSALMSSRGNQATTPRRRAILGLKSAYDCMPGLKRD